MASSLSEKKHIKRRTSLRAGVYLLIYTFCFCVCLFLLHVLSEITLESIEIAIGIEVMNITVLFLLGITLFTIVSTLQDMEFTGFMIRMHREITSMKLQGPHPIGIRPKKLPDWQPKHLNSLLTQLESESREAQNRIQDIQERIRQLKNTPERKEEVLRQIKKELANL